MTDFDRYLHEQAELEQTEIPFSVKNRIETVLSGLPDTPASPCHTKKRIFPQIAAAIVSLAFVTLFLLPNISTVYAHAVEKIPLIGDIVKVFTVRNYFYSDEYHEMSIDIPKIIIETGNAATEINKEIDELTNIILHRFYEELEIVGNNGHGSVYVDYSTVIDSDKWFTLGLRVHEASGSSNTYFRYYNINKATGMTVILGDLSENSEFYDVLKQDIKRQMNERMDNNKDETYWTDNSFMGKDFISLDRDHNFYFNESGDIVIPFDKYEVSPGYMGTPEFTVKSEVFEKLLKPEFAELISDMHSS